MEKVLQEKSMLSIVTLDAGGRSMHQLSMSYYQRRNIITCFYGFSEEEVRKAKRQAKYIKRLRSMSTAWSHLETALESSRRTAKLFVIWYSDALFSS
jgi:hypothetical protein